MVRSVDKRAFHDGTLETFSWLHFKVLYILYVVMSLRTANPCATPLCNIGVRWSMRVGVTPE